MLLLVDLLKAATSFPLRRAQATVASLVRHLRPQGAGLGLAADALRSRRDLLLENALLRHQLAILRRRAPRPRLRTRDRIVLQALAAIARTWRSALLIVQPATVLRWHRDAYRLHWRARSPSRARPPRVAPEVVALLQRMATDNPIWGAERIRGELRKLGIRLAKRTVQKYLRRATTLRPTASSWNDFLRRHAAHTWACDFLVTPDLFFRPLFVFALICLGTRELKHIAVTRNPSTPWIAQQLREATPFGDSPRYLVRDNDAKYATGLDRILTNAGTTLRSPPYAPKANGTCERLLGTLRRECVDHVLPLNDRHLACILREYRQYYNHCRPHQALAQRPPRGRPSPERPVPPGWVVATPVLGGLHHHYEGRGPPG